MGLLTIFRRLLGQRLSATLTAAVPDNATLTVVPRRPFVWGVSRYGADPWGPTRGGTVTLSVSLP